MDHSKTLTRSSIHFLSGTLLSRITGMCRDMLMAFCFGTHPAIAAFWVAFRLANLMRRVFGEGALTVGFVPHFATIHQESPTRAAAFFRDLVISISLVLMALIALSEMGLLSAVMWGDLSDNNLQIMRLTAIMMPGLLFIFWCALFSAFLQSHQDFFLSGVSPVAFNIVWMAAALALREREPVVAAQGLAIAITGAFFFQFVVILPRALSILRQRLSRGDWLRAKLFSPDLRLLLSALSLGVVGVTAMQINSALDALFARYASLEGPAYLTFAIRIQQLPLALFAIAISSAALPVLSRAMAEGDRMRFQNLLQFSLSRTFSLVFPCTVALFVMGGAAVNLIYGHGQFERESVIRTSQCLFGYAIGLVPTGFTILMASAFYARKDYWTPMICSLLSIGVNLILNGVLIFGLQYGAVSVAISTSVAALCNAFLLSCRLQCSGLTVFSKTLVMACAKTAFSAVFAGAAVATMSAFLLDDPVFYLLSDRIANLTFPEWREQLLQLMIMGGIFVATLWLIAWVIGAKEILRLLRDEGAQSYGK